MSEKKLNHDFLSAIKTGHSGSIAGNPAHANMSQAKVFVCNAHADISDYKKIAVDDKAFNAILQNCTKTFFFGKTGTGMRTGMSVALPSRITEIENLTELTLLKPKGGK